MEESLQQSIESATELIKKNKFKEAKSLLLDILKEYPFEDNAWFMLSLTLSSKDKKIYALEQSIKNNPNNLKAKSFLSKLNKDENDFNIADEYVLNDENLIKTEENLLSNDEKQYTIDSSEERHNVNETIKDSPINEEINYEINKNGILGLRKNILNTRLENIDEDSNGSEFEEFINQPETEKRKKRKKPKKKISKILLGYRIFLSVLVILFSLSWFLLNNNGYLNYRNGKKVIAYANDKIGEVSMLFDTKTSVPSTITSVPTLTNTPSPTKAFQTIEILTPSPTETIEPLSFSIQEKLNFIKENVHLIRGLDTSVDVSDYFVSNTYLQNILIDNFNSDLFVKDYVIETDVLTMLGLVSPEHNQSDHAMNSWIEGRGGLYLPNEDSIYLNGFNLNIVEQFLYILEYTQYLIDHNFSIDVVGEKSNCLTIGQSCQASVAFIKGDAYLLSEFWVAENLLDYEKSLIINLVEKNYFISSEIPSDFSNEDFTFNNTYGLEFARHLYEYGGWDYLNFAHSDPPRTTEQIMHPEKYIAKEGEIYTNPKPLSIILDGNWKSIKVGNLGEWRTYLLLSSGIESSTQIDKESSLNAAAGWGGDHYQFYKNDRTNEKIFTVLWIMDSTKDKEELYNAMDLHLSKGFGTPFSTDEGSLCWKTNLTYSCIYKKGYDVVWVQSPNTQIVSSVIDLYFD